MDENPRIFNISKMKRLTKLEKQLLERVIRPLVDSDYFDALTGLPGNMSPEVANKMLSEIHRKISSK
jgi:hypothetical protein